ncbi:MAG: hypothetical protein AABM32_04375 [Chloroflexota bacterium]
MQPTKPQVPSGRNVGARPDYVSMESGESLRPMPPPADCALKLKFVSLKQDPLMCAHMTRDFLAIQWREDRVTDSYWLRGLDRGPGEVLSKAVPFAMVDAN